MTENNSSSRAEQESLKQLEQAFSEFDEAYRRKQPNLIDLTKKFTEYYKLFKEIFPECVKEYDLKSPWSIN